MKSSQEKTRLAKRDKEYLESQGFIPIDHEIIDILDKLNKARVLKKLKEDVATDVKNILTISK